ncbi:MAG: Uma2 family endonuclease [Okeania sp. SIO3B5]|uniref:Uma2 family endonuclease n=1 Tax=Okeania sp. SIO3B5 TaxID=2607811 RepID=UPI001401591C|nr:Uma2 family endonuclease [Okeania sp. SIO3B5]NEO54850.1 Uma2 family endonuclease [Okeania sp. SIO3B5]
MTNLTIEIDSIIDLTDEQFFQLCQINKEIRFERNAKGDLIIVPLMGGETGMINAEICGNLGMWNRQTKLGVGFNSSVGYQLPNGAKRSPSCSWIPIEKWNNLTPEQREKFLPFCPDFLVELMSPWDSLSDSREKMKEYLENGMRLGWLINRKNQQVEIYRADKDVEILDSPDRLSGEDVLPGFILEMTTIL